MCTAVYRPGYYNWFGRNLDVVSSYGEQVVITPGYYPIKLKHLPEIKVHYAIIGMAVVENNYPLYFDAMNEKGLCVAGLAFKDNCVYHNAVDGMENTASYEFILRVLATCKNIEEVIGLIKNMNITNDAFSEEMPPEPLHFLVADKSGAIAVEPMAGGVFVHMNRFGVLTNNPPFPMQISSLNKYAALSPVCKQGDFARKTGCSEYSTGMGTLGLPGDLTSESRFVRALFVKENIMTENNEMSELTGFFNILSSVAQPKGLNILQNGKAEYTLYSSCCNFDKGIYYYKTYDDSRINAVSLRKENLGSSLLCCFTKKQKNEKPRYCN